MNGFSYHDDIPKRKRAMTEKGGNFAKQNGENHVHLIQDFILPSLEKRTFGELLKWDDQFPGVFLLKWTHKAKSAWSEEQCAVFLAWDEMKGRTMPATEQDYVDSKQRLRAALRQVTIVEELNNPYEHSSKAMSEYKYYRMTTYDPESRKVCLPRAMTKKKFRIKKRPLELMKYKKKSPGFSDDFDLNSNDSSNVMNVNGANMNVVKPSSLWDTTSLLFQQNNLSFNGVCENGDSDVEVTPIQVTVETNGFLSDPESPRPPYTSVSKKVKKIKNSKKSRNKTPTKFNGGIYSYDVSPPTTHRNEESLPLKKRKLKMDGFDRKESFYKALIPKHRKYVPKVSPTKASPKKNSWSANLVKKAVARQNKFLKALLSPKKDRNNSFNKLKLFDDAPSSWNGSNGNFDAPGPSSNDVTSGVPPSENIRRSKRLKESGDKSDSDGESLDLSEFYKTLDTLDALTEKVENVSQEELCRLRYGSVQMFDCVRSILDITSDKKSNEVLPKAPVQKTGHEKSSTCQYVSMPSTSTQQVDIFST